MAVFGNGIIVNKTFEFALRTIKLCKYLKQSQKDYAISSQLVRSGTSIGANVREAVYAQSVNDFICKLTIAIKEANETHYWLELAYGAEWLTKQEFDSIIQDCDEILKLLTSTINTTKKKMK
ncbi:MAG: four helix bundle protein [Bacteroidaceae bacterium]|nr:four helix bundle protein [Bacteroidaceae bacterium]